MKERLVYLFFKLFKFIINLLPDKLSYHLVNVLGAVAYYLVKDRRELAIKNIKRSLNVTDNQAKQLAKGVFQDIAIKFVEILKLETKDISELEDNIKIDGKEHLEKLVNSDRGAVLFTGHFGNWELLGIYLAVLGYPLTAIARDFKNEYIYQEIMKIRESTGAEIFNRSQIKKTIKSLLRQKFLLIAGDQDAHQDGEFMQFFDRPASTPLGPVKLAQRTNSLIAPIYLAREGFNNYRIIVKEPLEIAEDATLEEQRKILQKLTTSLEDVIREYPEQWLWVHRRWKTKVEECSND